MPLNFTKQPPTKAVCFNFEQCCHAYLIFSKSKLKSYIGHGFLVKVYMPEFMYKDALFSQYNIYQDFNIQFFIKVRMGYWDHKRSYPIPIFTSTIKEIIQTVITPLLPVKIMPYARDKTALQRRTRKVLLLGTSSIYLRFNRLSFNFPLHYSSNITFCSINLLLFHGDPADILWPYFYKSSFCHSEANIFVPSQTQYIIMWT